MVGLVRDAAAEFSEKDFRGYVGEVGDAAVPYGLSVGDHAPEPQRFSPVNANSISDGDHSRCVWRCRAGPPPLNRRTRHAGPLV